MLGEFLEQKTQRPRRGIPPREQHGHDLIADDLAIPRAGRRQSVQERLIRLFLQGRDVQAQDLLDVRFDERIDDLEARPKAPPRDESIERPNPRYQILHPLHLRERPCELCLRVVEAVDTVTQQIVRRRIQSEPISTPSVSPQTISHTQHQKGNPPRPNIPIKQRRNVDLFPAPPHQPHQLPHMPLKDLQIRHPPLHKLRPYQLPTSMPRGPIRRKDTLPQKLPPILPERLPLPISGKLRRQHGLDVLGLRREDEALPADGDLYCFVAPARGRPGEEPVPEGEVGVVAAVQEGADHDVDV